jgi:uncharacterized lipoprotein YmbA
MNKAEYRARFAAFTLAALLGGGCINFDQTADPTRFYVLSPLPAKTAPADAPAQLAVGLGRVDLPSYLIDPRIAVRHGTHEIRYSDFHQWAERMDKGLQRVLAANLSRLIASNALVLPTWNRRDVAAELYVSVQQFEADARGHITLEARWRITSPGGEVAWQTEHARIEQPGPSLDSDAEGATAALSAALAELSRQIAVSVPVAVQKARPQGLR